MILKHIINFFLSLQTSIWLLGLFIAVFFAGAFIMPIREEFRYIHSVPLFEWLKEHPLWITWWLWGSIGILSVLTINTIFCSIESIIKKRRSRQWLLIISPQIIHIGFLFLLLAHLLSSAGGFKDHAVAKEGTFLQIPDSNIALHVKDIDIRLDAYGFITDWAVGIEYFSEGNMIKNDRISPNNPSLKGGLNINVKDLTTLPKKAVLLQVSREPGALWALIGGILFMAGTVTLIVLKAKLEK